MTATHAPGALAGRAALASVATATFLLALKAYAAWATGSVAMLGSLADTTLDLFASLVTLFSVRYAAQPADNEHRFGHGKAEALAALFQVGLIAASALAIAWRAIDRLSSGHVTAAAESGIIVSVIAMIATGLLITYQRSILKRTQSIAVQTDRLHYQSDLALNGAVIAALLLDQYLGIGWADPLFGIVIALWLLWGAWHGGATAIDMLMDKQWPADKQEAFLRVAAAHPALKGIHDFRARSSGSRDFVQFHVWVDGAMTIREAHRVMDEVEAALEAEFPDTEVLIHPDPEGLVNEEGPAGRDLTEELEAKP